MKSWDPLNALHMHCNPDHGRPGTSVGWLLIARYTDPGAQRGCGSEGVGAACYRAVCKKLADLRRGVGPPSFRTIESLSKGQLPRSTAADAVTGGHLPLLTSSLCL
jgi:hypothetical protein